MENLKNDSTLRETVRFQVLRSLDANPKMSQRESGVSLGMVNYCLSALIKKGAVKVNNFKTSRHKIGYMYVVAPRSVAAKAELTKKFLMRKIVEYEALRDEIELLKTELLELEGRSSEQSDAIA